ncbi:ArsR family transcriptional regulator [Halorubrum alkaliphilum]|uniref:ArsR family transcriptional regulator n=1 Tax=Halorubrum alkaliphilum TaxID=261290 RepID=A0A8T4GGM2_9EURY|nr:ArsR family transcriptional regulator [Halorubrum alkaliphilum]MBP1923303.1 ArsR family transcriptional regulator [Halorubrum alkaliphilum]
MDSAVLLDLLGNENRRRILRLLARKPCYVTEISEYLGVSPKAVIDHLRKLEDAGLIESTTDDQRRKYFRITRSLRLEVSVSPYGFGAKSAYPARSSLDMSGRCPHLSLDVGAPDEDKTRANADGATTDGAGTDAQNDHRNGADGGDEPSEIAEIAAEYGRLQEIDRELSLAQRWVHGRVEDALAEIDERLGTEADSRFYAAILAALTETDGTPESVAEEVGSHEDAVTDALRRLSDVGVVSRDGDAFRIR